MNKKKVAQEVIQLLRLKYPEARIALNFGTEFELLVAVILSAQCTDVRVNMVTPALFARYPSVADFASADLAELERMIYSTGFYKNKAKNIVGAARKVVRDFGGRLPRSMEDILSLPGVARKTANVVLSELFAVNEGIVVDTHVIRISGLLGLVDAGFVRSKNAVKIEEELMRIVPYENWRIFPHLLIHHGRKICIARRPKCEICPLKEICPSALKRRLRAKALSC